MEIRQATWKLLLAMVCITFKRATAQMIFQVTVRDFLPIGCMNLSQFTALGISDSVLTESNYNQVPFEVSNCPYQSSLDSELTSGHPDFMRPHTPGWDMSFLFDNEDIFGANAFLSGTCDADQLQGAPRPPNLPGSFGACRFNHQVYSPRFNRTTMDIAPSGLPKPQYCTKDPNGRCGFYLDSLSQPVYQTANKFFQEMWYEDNAKYNKRIGTTLELKTVLPGVFEFSSDTDAENAFVAVAFDNFYAPHGQTTLVLDEASNPDPFEAKAWPQMLSNFGELKGTNKYLFTSEIHDFFQFKGSESLQFSGDDDIWVYINGILALDLGGLHAAVTQSIDLSNPLAMSYLNLVVGEIYTFDLFHAERMPTGSNFRLISSLGRPCNILVIGSVVFPSVAGNSFNKGASVVFPFVNGNVYSGSEIQLLPPGTTLGSSFIFVEQKIDVNNGFVVQFTFSASGNPEGFAFLLHSRENDLVDFPASTGEHLGFQGVERSVAIAFDLCTDRATPGNTCQGQEVSVYYPQNPGDGNEASPANRRVHDSILLSLANGDEHVVKIEYFSKPDALQVTIDNSLYLREMPFDPVKAMNSSSAFMGFTASGGVSSGGISISDWSAIGATIDVTQTVAVDFDASSQTVTAPKEVVADNVQAAGYSIQTRDLCGNDFASGGKIDNTVGKYVEVQDVNGAFANGRTFPLVVDAEIVDANDGTYSYSLRTLAEGQYALYFYYGDVSSTCTLDVVVPVVPNSSAVVTLGETATDGCFYGTILNAVNMLTFTEAPSNSPTDAPTSAPSQAPVIPTSTPSNSPSNSPSTLSPTSTSSSPTSAAQMVVMPVTLLAATTVSIYSYI